MSKYRLNHDRIWLKAGKRTSRLYEAEQKAAVQPFRQRIILVKKTGRQPEGNQRFYHITVERYAGRIITSRRFGIA